MDAAPARALAWWHDRPRRSGAQRRAQKERAHARAIQHLLGAFAEVQAHRGGQLTVLGEALLQALSPAPAADTDVAAAATAAAVAAPFPPGVWEPLPAHPGYVQATTTSRVQPASAAAAAAAPRLSPEEPLIFVELQHILGPEIVAAQGFLSNRNNSGRRARLCQAIDIMDLAFQLRK